MEKRLPGAELQARTSTRIKPGRMGLRWGMAVIFFIVGLIAYMDRSNISIVAKPMMEELNIDKVQFGLLTSLFFLGYCLAQIPGGMLAEKYGARKIIAIAVTFWSFFTALTAAATSYVMMCIVRFFFGIGEGPMYPGNASFNSYWFQKHEKGRAASALLSGSFFGPVIAPTLGVAIMTAFGWKAVFYIFAGAGALIAIVWFIIGRDRPEQHPWISEAEKQLILTNRSANSSKNKAPWGQYLRNPRFWAIGGQYLVVLYMNTFFLTWLPTYLMEARGFSLQSMGIAASFPWLALCMVTILGGVFSDMILRTTNSLMKSRGYVAIAGFLVFILGLYMAAYATTPATSVLWLTVGLGALGLPFVVSWALANDLGKEFAGSVSGWMNVWGSAGGVIAPIVCGWMAQTFGWEKTILINIIPVLGSIILWLFIRPDRPLLKEGLEAIK
ncbi:putative sulfoacetate transporter SauU [compost metagenome]